MLGTSCPGLQCRCRASHWTDPAKPLILFLTARSERQVRHEGGDLRSSTWQSGPVRLAILLVGLGGWSLAQAAPVLRPAAPASPQALPAATPPQPVTAAGLPSLGAPQDLPYPGLIALTVDASDLDHHAFHVAESVPVKAPVGGAGEVVLLLPKWLPGNHAPTGPLAGLAGLSFRADGKGLAWTRDPIETYAFHVTVPAGTTSIEADFDLVTPTDPKDGRVVVAPGMVDLQWSSVVLYPQGYFSRGVTVAPRLVLPTGWKYATALETDSPGPDGVRFRPTDLETLVDSPVLAGANAAQIDLDPGGPVPVRLNIFADRPESMVLRADQLAAHRNLVREAYRLFGNHRFDHYDFLMALSDQISPVGLEHARSSEDGVPLRYFSDWEKLAAERDLLPHEFTHSWNGKFRRPADLYTATFDTPMRDSLLWVYEGQTQYWGRVLAARSGLVTRQQALDMLAQDAAAYEARIGRRWRPLQDTVNEPIIGYKVPKVWPSWQRSTDYYVEGALIWLDVDTLIREQTRGQRSLDDFARAFFGAGAGEGTAVRTYVFEDVVQALDAVLPYDWAGFLRARLDRFGAGASPPLDGLARGGYRLVYTDLPNDSFRLDEARRHGCDLTFSLGLSVDQHGLVREVTWEGPAYQAGLAPGATLVALNGVAFDPEALKEAVRAARTEGSPPLELIVRTGDIFRIVHIAYHGGLRYPRLERDPAVPARLDDILAPHARRGEGG